MGRCHQCFGWRKEGPDERDEELENEARAITEEARREATRETIAFSFREIATATNNFRDVIGEGGFGAVYKGRLIPSGQIIAVKNLNRSGLRASEREFRVEAMNLSLLRHPNLVKVIGYCAQGDMRLLGYEFMSFGSLAIQLHGRRRVGSRVLNWDTRMKIAAGVAKGLNYLHNVAVPPVIYRDLKSTNVLLGPGFHAKLSNFGLVKFRPKNDNSQQASTRVRDKTNGYLAPEYCATGNATIKSDVYSFGILLLELISGTRPPIETIQGNEKHMLIDWARPLLDEPTKLIDAADQEMERDFSDRCLRRGLEVALMCVEDDPERRPNMSVVVEALDYLTSWTSVTNAFLEHCRNTPPANSVAQSLQSPRRPPAIEEENEEDDSDENTKLLRRKPVKEGEGTSMSKTDETAAVEEDRQRNTI